MTPERFRHVGEIYHAALAVEAQKRASFLDHMCAGDAELRSEVESLIASHEQAADFIDAPALAVAAELLAETGADALIGQTIARYRIDSLLGAGGMGRVYLADDTLLGRRVALKFLPEYFTNDKNQVQRFRQEARAASALNHPNILTVYEVGQVNRTEFMATEYVEGETLRARLKNGSFTPREALNVATQIADALVAAHEAGIVHRDMKPENVMLRRDGYVKVLDFGLAKLTENLASIGSLSTQSSIRTNPGVVMGTVSYMSPEQARGGEIDGRTDIWSLGVVLYEMLTGRAPFEGETASHLVVSILETDPPTLAQFMKKPPAELERIVRKMLRKNRDERYETVKDLALDLKNLKQELEVEARLERFISSEVRKGVSQTIDSPAKTSARTDVGVVYPTSSAEYLVNEIKRHSLTAALAAAAVIVLVATVTYFYIAKRNNSAASSGETIDSLAVLPFVNASNDPNTEYVSDGLSDSIIDSLSQLPNLKKVISLSSVLRYKGRQTDPQAVGRELNVRAVFIGRLTQRGDDLSVSTELVDVKDNKQLWAGQYSGKSADILKLQGEIARDISERLRLRLTAEQKERLTRRYTENAEAYQLYLQGRYYLNKFTDEGRIKSSEYFQKAIEKDPNFALGYVGLADAYANFALFGQMPPKEAWQKSEQAAVKALAIDDGLGEAHCSLAAVKMRYDWNWAGAEREFKRAIELNPEYERSHRWYASLLREVGRFDEAIAEAKQSKQLGPFSGVMDLVEILYFARRYDEAIAEALKGRADSTRGALLHLALGEVYVQQGRYKEALAEMLQPKTLVDSPRRLARIGYVYAAAGKRDEAIKILAEVKESTRERYDLASYIAAIYAALGNKDQAFAWLEKACDEYEYGVSDLKVSPRWDTLRSDPRFTSLLWRMKLAS
jgi:eukaryotic-like serine/threonine-protein kinase